MPAAACWLTARARLLPSNRCSAIILLEHAYAEHPGPAEAADPSVLGRPRADAGRTRRPAARLQHRAEAPGARRGRQGLLGPGIPLRAHRAVAGALWRPVAAHGRAGDRRPGPGGRRPQASAARLRGRGAAAGAVPARPGRPAGAAALGLTARRSNRPRAGHRHPNPTISHPRAGTRGVVLSRTVIIVSIMSILRPGSDPLPAAFPGSPGAGG